MLAQYRHVYRPLQQFKFRGATVRVDAASMPMVADRFKLIKSASQDAKTINALYKRYGLSTSNALKQAVQHARTRDVTYRVTVSMGGRDSFFDTPDLSRWGFREEILTRRRRLIDRLRDGRTKPRKLSEMVVSPYRIAQGYNGSVSNDMWVYGSSRVGYVHSRAGQIFKLAQARASRRMFDPVRPMTAERHVGIEIECGIVCSRETLGYKLKHLAGYVMIKGDGSVAVASRNSVELNICAPISRYKEILKGVTDVLNGDPEVSARVNKTCGLHVHLDVREWRDNFTALSDKYAKLISVQGILYSMQPRSRQDNTYCKKSTSRSIVRGACRYKGVNAQSIWKYTTIETRLHAGTTDYTKIANWVDLLAGIMYSEAVTPKRALSKVQSVFKYYNNLPTNLMEYIVGRVRQFADSHAEEAEVAEA